MYADAGWSPVSANGNGTRIDQRSPTWSTSASVVAAISAPAASGATIGLTAFTGSRPALIEKRSSEYARVRLPSGVSVPPMTHVGTRPRRSENGTVEHQRVTQMDRDDVAFAAAGVQVCVGHEDDRRSGR